MKKKSKTNKKTVSRNFYYANDCAESGSKPHVEWVENLIQIDKYNPKIWGDLPNYFSGEEGYDLFNTREKALNRLIKNSIERLELAQEELGNLIKQL